VHEEIGIELAGAEETGLLVHDIDLLLNQLVEKEKPSRRRWLGLFELRPPSPLDRSPDVG
jgi:hypothetical protein